MELLPVVDLIRLEEGPEGTFGVLLINRKVFCFTLEKQDLLNKENVSNIPGPQQYTCEKYYSPKFNQKLFKVLDVPGRNDIIIHYGNALENTKGCILLGMQVGHIEGIRAILNSVSAVNSFMFIMKDVRRFLLTITYKL